MRLPLFAFNVLCAPIRSAAPAPFGSSPFPRGGLALGTALALFGSTLASAHAATLTNTDDKERKITIIEGELKHDHTLNPSAVLSDICLKGCIIRLGESVDDEYVLEGPEVVSIEDMKLFDDGPDSQTPLPPAPIGKAP